MTEVLSLEDSKGRVEFVRGEQKRFLTAIKTNHVLSDRKLTEIIGTRRRTLRGWIQERCHLPCTVLKKLHPIFPTEGDSALKHIRGIKHHNWGQIEGGKKSQRLLLSTHRNEEVERMRRDGRLKGTATSVANKTKRLDMGLGEEVSELYGVLVGDGCLSLYMHNGYAKRAVRIDGSINDEIYYNSFLVPLIYKIFHKRAKVRKRTDCNGIYISFLSHQIFEWFKQELSFPVGRKSSSLALSEKIFSLPQKQLCAVLRGIADTDGALFFVADKYPQIRLTSKSEILINQLAGLLDKMGFKSAKRKDHVTGVFSVTISGKGQLEKWMDTIGFNNLSQLSKYLYWKKFGECQPNKDLPLGVKLKILGRESFPTSIETGPYLFWQNLAR